MKLELAPLHDTFLPGDLVQTWASLDTFRYGVITSAGTKRVGILWEEGHRQSLHRKRFHLIRLVPEHHRDEARKATRRVREELLATQTRERLGNL